MTKPVLTMPSLVMPLQQSLETLPMTTGKIASAYAGISGQQFAFLQKTVFDAAAELQSLSTVRDPAQFIEQSTQIACRQAERSLQAWTDLGADLYSLWLNAMGLAPDGKARK